MKYKKWKQNVIAALLWLLTTPAWAAAVPPITLEAGTLVYSENSGDFHAEQNVKMVRDQMQIFADMIDGNVNSGDVVANGHVVWLEGMDKLTTGEQLEYNYKTEKGQMGAAEGIIGGQIISAEKTVLLPESSIVYNSMVTGCPAHIPDYKITAEKIIIYPGEKLVAHHASFWIKNIKLFSLSKYEKRLDKKDEETSAMPKIGYYSDDGFYIKQRMEFPLRDKLTAMGELSYYSERGLEYQAGLIQRSANTKLSLITGSDRNSDGEWYEMRPELTYEHFAMPLGKNPLTYGYQLQAGQIFDETTNKELWRERALVWIAHNPIKLGADTTLNLNASYEYDLYEGHDDRKILGLGGSVDKKFSDRVTAGIGYHHYDISGSTPFEYDKVDVERELKSYVEWQVDRFWNLGVSTTYDLGKGEMYDVDYTIKRRMHCFEAAVTYREKRNEWRYKINVVNW